VATDATSARRRPPTSLPSIVDVVLAVRGRQRPWRLPLAVLVATGMHGGLWLWAQQAEPPGPSLADKLTAPAPELSLDRDVDLVRPAPPPPRVDPPTAPATPARTTPPGPQPQQQPQPQPQPLPPPPAEAGAIVAQEPDPGTPLDLTGEAFVTGAARGYAGGVTASAGTNAAAVGTGDVDRRSAPTGGHAAGSDLSGAVSLADQSWSCAWPAEADTQRIDEQTVVIQVVVDAEGNTESAEVVADPGHGFGQAATTCAMNTRFTPARDRAGQPVRARSPLIRVRFTR
jgi:periplasmic protein TonB